MLGLGKMSNMGSNRGGGPRVGQHDQEARLELVNKASALSWSSGQLLNPRCVFTLSSSSFTLQP